MLLYHGIFVAERCHLKVLLPPGAIAVVGLHVIVFIVLLKVVFSLCGVVCVRGGGFNQRDDRE